jgi:hypothetical protein
MMISQFLAAVSWWVVDNLPKRVSRVFFSVFYQSELVQSNLHNFTKIMLLFALQFMGSAWCHLLFNIHEAKRPFVDLNMEKTAQARNCHEAN